MAAAPDVAILPWKDSDPQAIKSVVVEGFPGVTIRKALELMGIGYKGRQVQHCEERKGIVRALKKILPLPEAVARRAINDPEGDALDALVLLLAGWVAQHYPEWNKRRDELIAERRLVEGWFPASESISSPPSQMGNVGNPGDTLKHAPIPDLVDVLLAASRRVAYVDPFAFALDAPLSPKVGYARWLDDLEARRSPRPTYDRLLDLQRPRLAAGGTYRCGIGLALGAIGSSRLSWLLAAESDPHLRHGLENGLRGIGLASALVGGRILADAAETPVVIEKSRTVAEAGDGLFALIDPFTIRSCPWEPVLEGLAMALRPGAHAIALAFTYGNHDWPGDLSPAGQLRRVRRIREGPYQLAAYATGSVAKEVERVLDGFGWT